MKHLLASGTHGTETSMSENETRILSRREVAKAKRHALYQSAKARRATDPRYLAAKEAAKVQRRAAYQKVKEHRKAVAAEEKSKRKPKRIAECTSRHIEGDRAEVLQLLRLMLQGSRAQND